jgi:hypothetical protein
MTNFALEVAKTIASQIPVMDKMAIGYREPQMLAQNDERSGGLNFRVNSNRKYCDVELTYMDTYRVTYFRFKRGTNERIVLASSDDVYCHELGTTLYSMTQATDQFNAEGVTK